MTFRCTLKPFFTFVRAKQACILIKALHSAPGNDNNERLWPLLRITHTKSGRLLAVYTEATFGYFSCPIGTPTEAFKRPLTHVNGEMMENKYLMLL